MSPKDTMLAIRVSSELKAKLEDIAAAEGRSVAQVCDAFLQGGLIAYSKQGSKYFTRLLARNDSRQQNR